MKRGAQGQRGIIAAGTPGMARRAFARGLGVGASGLVLAGFSAPWTLAPPDLVPPPGFGFGSLRFTMTDAETAKTVTAADFRGKVVMLFFGYTNCPDECPLTLNNAARIIERLGPKAASLRFLFVTVDPARDTLAVLRGYTHNFGTPNIIGLRGSEAELAALAKRMGARYSVHPSPDPLKYAVTHTLLTYVFNREGVPAFSIAGLAEPKVDLQGIARDLEHLLAADRV
ncbi:MAG: SCO family protein [Rhodospirillales bacterium]|nr:SCO family protein [Rhodospirillales bacterium]